MRRLLATASLFTAVISSIATSPVDTRWTVYGRDRGTVLLDRDTEGAAVAIDVQANALAMDMPLDPEAGDGFSSTLSLDVELATRGVFGVGANEVDVMLVVLDAEGVERAAEAVFVEPFERTLVSLEVPDALADCALGEDCDRSFELQLVTESDEPSRVRAYIEARLWLRGPSTLDEPEDAEIEVVVSALP